MFLSVLLLVFLHRKKHGLPLFLWHASTYMHGSSKLAATDVKTEIRVDVIFLLDSELLYFYHSDFQDHLQIHIYLIFIKISKEQVEELENMKKLCS